MSCAFQSEWGILLGFRDRNLLLANIVNGADKQKRVSVPRARSRFHFRGYYQVPFRTWHTTVSPFNTVFFDRKVNYFTFFEQMNDVVGNPKGENKVDHVICNSARGSRTLFTYTSPDGTQTGGSGFGPWEEVSFPDIHNKVPVVDFSTLGDQATRAIQHVTSLVPTSVLLPNFIWELRGLKDLPETIRRLRKNWEYFDSFQSLRPRSLRRYAEWAKNPRVRKDLMAWITGKRLANLHLAKEFGLDPFIGDLRKLFLILEEFDKKLAFLKSTIGKRYKSGYREDLPVPANLMTPSGIGTTTLECVYYRATVNFTFVLSHDLPELDSLASRIKVAMALLGLNNPLAVIWEAIPYSFLVDWFVNVQDLISQFGTAPFLTGKVTVHKASVSVHQRASIDHCIDVYGNRKVTLDKYNLHRFWREPRMPTLSYLTLKTTLTDDQLLLVAALLRQRLSS